jgi:hypothetical protein
MQRSLIILVLSLGCMAAGALIGAWLRTRLPQHHLDPESTRIVTASVGLVSTMTALMLSLLISSAKASYDSTSREVNAMRADIVMADLLLAQYGPPANAARRDVRSAVNQLVQRLWAPSAHGAHLVLTSGWMKVVGDLEGLPNQTDAERSLHRSLDGVVDRLTQTRAHLFAESGTSLPRPFVVFVTLWLTVIFVSYTLFGKVNPTVMVFLFLCAPSSAGALYLVGELNTPFTGILHLSKSSLEDALPPLPG